MAGMQQRQKSYAAQALEEIARMSHITEQTLKFYRQSRAPTSLQISENLDFLLVLYNGKLLANNISVYRQYREGRSFCAWQEIFVETLRNIRFRI
jgi:two-component system, chemotaxis family, CheB/CheR fusion protein